MLSRRHEGDIASKIAHRKSIGWVPISGRNASFLGGRTSHRGGAESGLQQFDGADARRIGRQEFRIGRAVEAISTIETQSRRSANPGTPASLASTAVVSKVSYGTAPSDMRPPSSDSALIGRCVGNARSLDMMLHDMRRHRLPNSILVRAAERTEKIEPRITGQMDR
jgi:hypothetical protein